MVPKLSVLYFLSFLALAFDIFSSLLEATLTQPELPKVEYRSQISGVMTVFSLTNDGEGEKNVVKFNFYFQE